MNISKKEHPHRDLSTALRSGRDDKGEGGASRQSSRYMEAAFHNLEWAKGPGRLLFGNNSAWKHRPPLCHLDRSAAQWRDLRLSSSNHRYGP
jgi:hypothetical protein